MTQRAPAVLIVDDEAKSRRLLTILLSPEGYNTSSVASGKEALAAIKVSPPDLILLDIMMPGMDGYALAGLLKARSETANIPIIMVTARHERSARLAGLEAGAEEFLTKPVNRVELSLRVRNLLRLKAYGDLVNYSEQLERQVQARMLDLQRFRTAMDATADAILLVSRASMLFIEVNATACVLFGYTREEMFRIGPAVLELGTSAQLALQYDVVIAGGVRTALMETSLRRKDGVFVQVEVHRQALGMGTDWTIVDVVRDITERKDAQRRLQHLADHDALTGLPNRSLFYKTLRRTLTAAGEGNWQVAVMFIDLDHFKNLNDTLGHARGDQLLVEFSKRLMRCIRSRDTVGRLGGDEFALILVMPEGEQGAAIVARKIRSALQQSFQLSGRAVSLTASMGITVYPDDSSDPETLIKYADTAMYQAKHAGRDTARFFTAQMNADVLARRDIEAALHSAIKNQQFALQFQPKATLVDGKLAGMEALLRWDRPGYGPVAPAKFVPVLEETGLIIVVGNWVIATACAQIAAWMRSDVGPVQVSINVSSRQFVDDELESEIERNLEHYGIPASLLELELTETVLMADTARSTEILLRLKARGLPISIDDFGTGYSSLAYLRRFPLDKLKIDIAFIRHVTTNQDDAAIVLAIINLAHGLHLKVTAEGVETAAQVAFLQHHGCDQMQGYYFSEPLTAAAATHLLLHKKALSLE